MDASKQQEKKLDMADNSHQVSASKDAMLRNDELPSGSGANGSDELPSARDKSGSDELPSASGMLGIDELPSARAMSGSDELPSASGMLGIDQLPSARAMSGSDELPSATAMSGSDELPSASRMLGSDELPSDSAMSGSDELPSASGMLGNDELPSDSAMSGSDDLPSARAMSGSDELPSASGMLGSDELPSDSAMSGSDDLPSARAMSGSDELPSASGMLGSDELPSARSLMGGDQIPSAGDLGHLSGYTLSIRGFSQHDSTIIPDSLSVMQDGTYLPATFSHTAPSFVNKPLSDLVQTRSELREAFPGTDPAQKSDIHRDMDAVLTEKTEFNKDIQQSSCNTKSFNAIMKHVTFFESDILQTASPNTNPKVFIKLMRVKSSSEEHILDLGSFIEDTPTSGPEVENAGNASSPDMVPKRGGYLQRVRDRLKPRSSSLTIFDKVELKSKKEVKIRKSNLKKTKLQTFISQNDISIDMSRFLTKERVIVGNTDFIEEIHTRPATEQNETTPIDPAQNSQEFDTINDPANKTNTETTRLKVHKVERSYSLIRRENEGNDPSHVHFTRIPSLRVRRVHVTLAHHFTTVLPDDQTDGCHVIKEATNIEALKDGGAIVTDVLSSNIVLFDSLGYPKITFAVESGCEPWATCLTLDGGLAVTLKRQGCVSLWSTSGEPIVEFGHNILSGPAGIKCDKQGRLVVADEQLNSVCVFNINGELLTKLHVPDAMNSQTTTTCLNGNYEPSSDMTRQDFNHPRYVCITNSGNYIIADSANHCVKIFDFDMNFNSTFGRFGKGDGHFRFPYGISSDNESYLYVADHFNNRVSLFSPDGNFVEHLLTVQDGIVRPKSVAVRYPFLYVTHGHLRANKISVFRLRKDQDLSACVG